MQVYLVTNKANGKQYVGQTVKSLSQRWAGHVHESRYRARFAVSKAIAKYGKHKFTIETLYICKSKNEMNFIETLYIVLLGTLAPNGYNLTMGGEGCIPTEDTKKKISDKNKGKHLSASTEFKIGHKPSERIRSKMRDAKLGKKQSPATIAKRFARFSVWNHGTCSGYKTHRCRCALCRNWRVVYYSKTGN